MSEVFGKYKELKIERKAGGVLLITLDRPEVLNAMTYGMHGELARIWDDIDRDPATRVAVITGAGRAFCAGNDLNNPEPDFDGVREIMRDAIAIVRGMIECDKPIILAINGVAVGAGLAVAVLADVSIAAEDARLIDGHANVGVTAGDHACVIWPLLCGMANAKYYLWNLEPLTGRVAKELGIVTKALPADQVLDEALRIAGGARPDVAAGRARDETGHQWLAAPGDADIRAFRRARDGGLLRPRRACSKGGLPGQTARQVSFRGVTGGGPSRT